MASESEKRNVLMPTCHGHSFISFDLLFFSSYLLPCSRISASRPVPRRSTHRRKSRRSLLVALERTKDRHRVLFNDKHVRRTCHATSILLPSILPYE